MAGQTTGGRTSSDPSGGEPKKTCPQTTIAGRNAVAHGQDPPQTRMQAYLDEPVQHGNRLVMLPDRSNQADDTERLATGAMGKRLDEIMKIFRDKP